MQRRSIIRFAGLVVLLAATGAASMWALFRDSGDGIRVRKYEPGTEPSAEASAAGDEFDAEPPAPVGREPRPSRALGQRAAMFEPAPHNERAAAAATGERAAAIKDRVERAREAREQARAGVQPDTRYGQEPERRPERWGPPPTDYRRTAPAQRGKFGEPPPSNLSQFRPIRGANPMTRNRPMSPLRVRQATDATRPPGQREIKLPGMHMPQRVLHGRVPVAPAEE